ncbi:ISAs1-like element ISAli14 family transposase [Azospirillum lipoferum]|uniref:Transposase of ISAli4, ISAs1 family n=1 Tax=Azospirillum lipoferum (strain 4B) TaxID=862719 RepID=G7ZCY1_AZOL4|nr:ISAs1-like element ISAli14 family transposase [Azospirillum lipoferum]CBS89728.1 transposase of ISAli4, ISAs1 family [Azospirillum lipoferum 4B]
MSEEFDETFQRSRLRSLLDHFSVLKDPREAPEVRYPLREVLFLVVAATIADCEDYDEIALWGRNHLEFLRRFSEFHFGTPCADWLRVVMNRIGPDLFQACFTDWALALRPDAPKLIAIDGKTSRRSHDRAAGRKALHLVSAWATTERLVLAQEAVDEKENECAVIPEILERLDLNGAVVTIDAIACNPAIATAITERKGDYLLAVKANQPTLFAEIGRYFDDPEARIAEHTAVDKGHGRIESRRYAVSQEVDWLSGDRRYPDEPRFPHLKTIALVESVVEKAGSVSTMRRLFLSSAALTSHRLEQAVRGHWGIENCLHWVLDVTFREDQSRLRKGHGARNMAVVRHFAINAVRVGKGKHSIKSTRKLAGWDPNVLANLLTPSSH